MIDTRAASSVIAFQPISDRLAVLSISGTIKTHIISVYTSIETSSEPAKDDFYNQLQHVLDSIPQTEAIILAGDFNAHIGADRSGWESTMGNFGHGEINDNILCLLSFAASNNLIVGNNQFQHPRKHQLTWRNPSGIDSAILDYVLINTRFRSSLKDVRAMRGPDCGSDHYLVRARVQLKLQRAKRTSPPPVRLEWRLLMDPTCKQEFQIALSNRFATLARSENIDEEEKQISDAILECAKPLCPPARRRTQPWISDECLDLVDKRKQAKLVDYEHYRQLNREVRLRMKAEREVYWNKVAADLEEAASKHEYRTLYSTLRRLSGKTKSTNDNIRKTDGAFVRSAAERLQRWREFFEELYNHDPPHGPPAAPPPIDPPETPMVDTEPTIKEVKAASRSLKNGKAPGVDQVTAEAIKAGGDVLLHRLHLLVQTIWRTEQVPLRWRNLKGRHRAHPQERRQSGMQELSWHQPPLHRRQGLHEDNSVQAAKPSGADQQRGTGRIQTRTRMLRSNLRHSSTDGEKNQVWAANRHRIHRFQVCVRLCSLACPMENIGDRTCALESHHTPPNSF